MNVIKCKNGHFFDGDSYSQCPHCGAGAASDHSAQAVSQEHGGRRRFPWGKKEETSSIRPEPARKGMWGNGSSTTDALEMYAGGAREDSASANIQQDKTLDFWQAGALHSEKEPITEGGSHIDNEASGREHEETPVAVAVAVPPETDAEKKEDGPCDSLRDAVRKVSASSAGKTMSYFSAATGGASQEGAQFAPTEPVVGWIVCVGGNHFGQSFGIVAGKNAIGRNEENAIVLSRDHSVSRFKHALITYEPKKRNFYIQPGDSSGLTYLNEEYIDESKKLTSKDRIELGGSKFIFIPLCDESFTWEDYITKE